VTSLGIGTNDQIQSLVTNPSRLPTAYDPTMKRWIATTVVAFAVAASGCGGAGAPATQRTAQAQQPPFDLEEATIAELQRRMTDGRETARSLVDKYLGRIEAIDRSGPALKSVIEVNPDARAEADRLDGERKSKGPRGPLHGIPILIKDNIATGDKMLTTACVGRVQSSSARPICRNGPTSAIGIRARDGARGAGR
jgi:Amidase